jgi:splicing factor 3A subunit 1
MLPLHVVLLCCAGLTQREGTNPAFYFLKPTHSMFGFFTSLADAYSAVLMPDKGLKERLSSDASDRCAC